MSGRLAGPGLLVLGVAAMAVACGGTPTGPDMGGHDLSRASDLRTSSPDLTRSKPPDMTMSTPPDMSVCTGPAACGSGAPYCCADIVLGKGTVPNCPVTSVTVACKASCDGKIALSCNASDQVRLCQKSADCSDDPNGYTYCCDLTTGGVTQTTCISVLVKDVLKPTCLP